MHEAGKSSPEWLRADRLMIVAAGLLMVCVAALAFGLFNLAEVQEGGARQGARIRELRAAGADLAQAGADFAADQHGYLLTRDVAFAADNDRAALAAALRRLDAAAQDPALAASVARLHRLSAAMIDAANPAPGVANRTAALKLKLAMDALETEVSQLQSIIEQRAGAIRAQNAKARTAIYWVGGVLALFSLLAALLALWAIRRERQSWRGALDIMTSARASAETARAKAAASDLAKTRFLAAASHDMRQPLHALTLYLSALDRRIEGAEARDILAKAERAAQSMVGMFNTLLDLARIQADVVEPELQAFPLQDLLDRILSEHPEAAIAAPSHTPIEINSDPVLVARMLRNLISNALRHGGGAARIAVEAKGAVAEIVVSDNGPGIAAEDQRRIFEEFVRLDGRAGGEGLGLGLAIVKRIAELLDADLEVRSTPGAGAAFIVRLPIAAATARAAPTQTPARGAADTKILVVDDDPQALEAEVGVLRDLGADVRGCANETELNAALDAGFRPRLLVMDLRIDGVLEGVAIADRARARLTPPPHVIMVTGDTAPETLSLLRSSGHAWLIKPASREDLDAAIAAAQLVTEAT